MEGPWASMVVPVEVRRPRPEPWSVDLTGRGGGLDEEEERRGE